MKYLSILLLVFSLIACSNKTEWLEPESSFRLFLSVESGSAQRHDKPVEVELSLYDLKKFLGDKVDASALKLVETDKPGHRLNTITPIQFYADSSTRNSGLLTFLMPGITPANTTRYFQLYIGDSTGAQSQSGDAAAVSVEPNVWHEEQESFKINTPTATYFYHRFGAGFASLDDVDGNDWLSYNPGLGEESQSGSGGMYRGLPNSGYPEGYNHPGKEVSDSWIVENGPVKVTILSESLDKKMRCRWDIFPDYARLTYLTLRPPYWFLYEGTPGGLLEVESDFCVRLGNIKTMCAEKWDGDIDALGEPGEWLYFSDVATHRSIYLVQSLDDKKPDSYWPMNKEMTVFGFGRLGMEKSIVRQNNQFVIGLAETHDYSEMKKIIDSAYQPLTVKVSNIEAKPH